jgi:hypothetical protein
MAWWPTRRVAIAIALIAIPMEAAAMHLLSYAPCAGTPAVHDPGLQLWGSMSAVYHFPALLLNNFACQRGVHVRSYILSGNLIVSGYSLSLFVVRFVWLMFGGS